MDTQFAIDTVKKAQGLKGISCLIIDKDAHRIRKIRRQTQKSDIKIFLAKDYQQAFHIIENTPLHLVFCNIDIFNGNIYSLLTEFQKSHPLGLFYCISYKKYYSKGIELIKKGATDFFTEEIDFAQFLTKIHSLLQERFQALTIVDPILSQLQAFLLFRSEKMIQGLQILPQVAASKYNVLITGETGTGKEVVARAIHALSSFRTGAFLPVNCGAIPENLIESELFGHEKGAFTGALHLKKGKFELAHKGTLFLDEIGEMPLHLQVKLLRVLEDNVLFRIGSENPIRVFTRVVSATHASLEEHVENKLFREDLYYRLNILRIHLPPLRERKEDIGLLTWHFLQRIFDETQREKPYPYLTEDALHILKEQQWKGNVRELKNFILKVGLLLPQAIRTINAQMLKQYFDDPLHKSTTDTKNYSNTLHIKIGDSLSDIEKTVIKHTLTSVQGNKTRAAKILGIGTKTLRRKIKN